MSTRKGGVGGGTLNPSTPQTNGTSAAYGSTFAYPYNAYPLAGLYGVGQSQAVLGHNVLLAGGVNGLATTASSSSSSDAAHGAPRTQTSSADAAPSIRSSHGSPGSSQVAPNEERALDIYQARSLKLELDYEKKHRDSQGEVIQAQKLTAKSQDVAMTATQEVNAQLRRKDAMAGFHGRLVEMQKFAEAVENKCWLFVFNFRMQVSVEGSTFPGDMKQHGRFWDAAGQVFEESEIGEKCEVSRRFGVAVQQLARAVYKGDKRDLMTAPGLLAMVREIAPERVVGLAGLASPLGVDPMVSMGHTGTSRSSSSSGGSLAAGQGVNMTGQKRARVGRPPKVLPPGVLSLSPPLKEVKVPHLELVAYRTDGAATGSGSGSGALAAGGLVVENKTASVFSQLLFAFGMQKEVSSACSWSGKKNKKARLDAGTMLTFVVAGKLIDSAGVKRTKSEPHKYEIVAQIPHDAVALIAYGLVESKNAASSVPAIVLIKLAGLKGAEFSSVGTVCYAPVYTAVATFCPMPEFIYGGAKLAEHYRPYAWLLPDNVRPKLVSEVKGEARRRTWIEELTQIHPKMLAAAPAH